MFKIKKLIKTIKEGLFLLTRNVNELGALEYRIAGRMNALKISIQTHRNSVVEMKNIEKSLTTKIVKMEETVEFFTGIAELFANYIVFDLKNSPTHGYPRQKADIIACARKYLQERDIFWRVV